MTLVSVSGVISVNDSEAYLKCGLQGFGMIQLPRYMVTPYLQTGALREVLAPWAPAPMPISVAYLYNRHTFHPKCAYSSTGSASCSRIAHE